MKLYFSTYKKEIYLKLRKVIFVFSTLLISSCSTYSKKECLQFDWFEKGYKSALNGEIENEAISHYNQHCQNKHEISPDKKKIKLGYKDGLKIFCTPSHAEEFGRSGLEYSGTCNKKQEEKILKPYLNGQVIFLKNKVSTLESENFDLTDKVSELESQVSELESKISDLESSL